MCNFLSLSCDIYSIQHSIFQSRIMPVYMALQKMCLMNTRSHTEWTTQSERCYPPPSPKRPDHNRAQHHLPLVSRCGTSHWWPSGSPAPLFTRPKWIIGQQLYATIWPFLLCFWADSMVTKREGVAGNINAFVNIHNCLFHGKIKSPQGNEYTFWIFPILQQNHTNEIPSDDVE